jgi:hydroxyacylglutathione hydrolase
MKPRDNPLTVRQLLVIGGRPVKVRQFRYGADNLGYLVYGDAEAVAVDGGDVSGILGFLEENSLTLKYVTNTHSHGDHTGGNTELLGRTGAEFLSPGDLAREGSLEIEGESIRVIPTPGHTPDSICLYLDGILLSGDTLFNGKVGRCFTGDVRGFFKSISALVELPDDTLVYAGHDYVEEYLDFARAIEPGNDCIEEYASRYDPGHVVATLGEEKLVDPFLRLSAPGVISALEGRGLPAGTESERWNSLISLM